MKLPRQVQKIHSYDITLGQAFTKESLIAKINSAWISFKNLIDQTLSKTVFK